MLRPCRVLHAPCRAWALARASSRLSVQVSCAPEPSCGMFVNTEVSGSLADDPIPCPPPFLQSGSINSSVCALPPPISMIICKLPVGLEPVPRAHSQDIIGSHVSANQKAEPSTAQTIEHPHLTNSLLLQLLPHLPFSQPAAGGWIRSCPGQRESAMSSCNSLDA